MDVADTIQETYLRLADVLAAQPVSAWDVPSLCERWRVRDVVAHVTAAARYAPEEFLAEVQTDGGDFGATIDRIAARDGQREPGALLADLRHPRLHRWTPPGGGEIGALTHVVIHGLDITTPLGLDSAASEPALRAVLDALAGGGVHAGFGTHLDGTRLRATDLGWAWGEGRAVTATAADLILAMAGRDTPSVRLRASPA
jgi:uncharacterized protein (TIGR03083 family)